MRGKSLLDELIEASAKHKVTVRREAMSRGVSTGGYCVLKGVPTVFLDERASVDVQIDILASALKRFDWSATFLPPAVRAAITASGDDGTSS